MLFLRGGYSKFRYLHYANEYLLKPYSLRMYSNVNYGDKQAQRGLDQSHFIIRAGLFPY